jgi:transcriptional regulator with XRE-family HTH domain
MMEWGASRILALRKQAGMTQAQFARWLGVSVKQVKYLEHQRRNPSGPAQRLLSILETQLSATGQPTVQILGASLAKPKSPEPAPVAQSDDFGDDSASTESSADSQAVQSEPDDSTSEPADEAFVWS